MALYSALTIVLFLALVLARIDLSASILVEGSVSCLDCTPHNGLSGVRVAVECSYGRGLASALTNDKGYFKVEIVSNFDKLSSPSSSCHAKLLGGAMQLYSYKKSMVSSIVKAQGANVYTLSTPLTFLTSCPSKAEHLRLKKSGNKVEIGSSKTIDIPLPPEWGLAPSSYYLPYFPIIGIP